MPEPKTAGFLSTVSNSDYVGTVALYVPKFQNPRMKAGSAQTKLFVQRA